MTRRPDHAAICGVLGPDIRASAMYERPAVCNRIRGHERLKADDAALHTERDAHTFHLVASWTTPRDVRPNKRRIDNTPKPKGKGRKYGDTPTARHTL